MIKTSQHVFKFSIFKHFNKFENIFFYYQKKKCIFTVYYSVFILLLRYHCNSSVNKIMTSKTKQSYNPIGR